MKNIKRLDDNSVMRLKITLNLDNASDKDMETLRKYGKVKAGISREILVSSRQSLRQLHYMIQKLFGWQNSHLHKFELFDEDMEVLLGDSFEEYCMLCGLYFRFYYDDVHGMVDIYWDDDYKGEEFKSWIKRKYSGIPCYLGKQEHYLVAQSVISRYLLNIMDENGLLSVRPSFDEWRRGIKENRKVSFEDATFAEMNCEFEYRLGEVIERLSLGEILTLNRGVKNINAIYAMADECAKGLEENSPKLYLLFPRDGVIDGKLSIFLNETDGKSIPFTNKLKYSYDYGDGWSVEVALVEEYVYGASTEDGIGFFSNGVKVDGSLGEILAEVANKTSPKCISADGLPVLDDVGGINGYCEFLRGIHHEAGAGPYEDADDSKDWARSMGWTGRMSKVENML